MNSSAVDDQHSAHHTCNIISVISKCLSFGSVCIFVRSLSSVVWSLRHVWRKSKCSVCEPKTEEQMKIPYSVCAAKWGNKEDDAMNDDLTKKENFLSSYLTHILGRFTLAACKKICEDNVCRCLTTKSWSWFVTELRFYAKNTLKCVAFYSHAEQLSACEKIKLILKHQRCKWTNTIKWSRTVWVSRIAPYMIVPKQNKTIKVSEVTVVAMIMLIIFSE